MKRSEIIDKIFNLIRTTKLKTVADDLECANKVLILIEENGMLPPDRFNSEGSCYVNEWELE